MICHWEAALSRGVHGSHRYLLQDQPFQRPLRVAQLTEGRANGHPPVGGGAQATALCLLLRPDGEPVTLPPHFKLQFLPRLVCVTMDQLALGQAVRHSVAQCTLTFAIQLRVSTTLICKAVGCHTAELNAIGHRPAISALPMWALVLSLTHAFG